LKLCQFVFHAASCSNGGRKIRKMISGFKFIAGKPGIRLIETPASTSTIGKGKLNLLHNTARSVIPKSNVMIKAIFSIKNNYFLKPGR
jgi:hypothetical protein